MNDRQAFSGGVGRPGEFLLNALAVADQNHSDFWLVSDGLDGAQHDRPRGMISAPMPSNAIRTAGLRQDKASV